VGDGQLGGVVVVPVVEVEPVGGALEGSVDVWGVVVELGVVEVVVDVVVVPPDESVDWVVPDPELQSLPEELEVLVELLEPEPVLLSVAWPLPPEAVLPPLRTVGSVCVWGWVEVVFV
jgi:hypothetical protein